MEERRQVRAQRQLEREKRQAAADALVRRVHGTGICVMEIVFVVVVQPTLLLLEYLHQMKTRRVRPPQWLEIHARHPTRPHYIH